MIDYEIYEVPNETFEAVFPEVFEELLRKFIGFVNDKCNNTSAEDLAEWLREGWVNVYVGDAEVQYIPEWNGKDFPADDLPWFTDFLEDVQEDVEKIKQYKLN